MDPTTLIIGDNVRAAAHLDRQFLASLREHGVMNPIQATRADDGTLTVKRGQRRTLGAIKAGLSTVPVLVVTDDTDEADRIVKQWHENERRDALTETDRLAAVEQLTILGVPAGNIARRLGTPKKQVEAAVQANGSDLAKTAARKHALTLTDAALIAEFEDDEDTVRDILRAVKDGDSAEHVAQRARDDKARQQAQEAAVAALVEAGVTVIDRPGYDDKTIKELREIRLVKRNGDPKVNPPTEAEHATCPGHAAYVTTYYSGTPNVTYVCTNPKANGHALHSWNGETRLPGQQPGGGMSEEQKAERKTLIANNKAWDSATGAARVDAESFLTRTNPPKGAETFLALCRRPRRAHRGLQPDLRGPDPARGRGRAVVPEVLGCHPEDRGQGRRRPAPAGAHARPGAARLRVGIHPQPEHVAAPQRPGPAVPDRAHRLGLQALRRRTTHPHPARPGQAHRRSRAHRRDRAHRRSRAHRRGRTAVPEGRRVVVPPHERGQRRGPPAWAVCVEGGRRRGHRGHRGRWRRWRRVRGRR